MTSSALPEQPGYKHALTDELPASMLSMQDDFHSTTVYGGASVSLRGISVCAVTVG